MAESALTIDSAAAMTMKGIGFVNVHHFVTNKFGTSKWDEALGLMSREDCGVVRQAVAIGWYETRIFGQLLRAVDKACGLGDLSILREIGAFEAEVDFSRTLKLFLRALAPINVLKMQLHIWRHFQSAGQWKLITVEDGVDGILNEWVVDEAQCVELCGYLTRLLEFAGGNNVTVLHSECRSRGFERCVFRTRWQ